MPDPNTVLSALEDEILRDASRAALLQLEQGDPRPPTDAALAVVDAYLAARARLSAGCSPASESA